MHRQKASGDEWEIVPKQFSVQSFLGPQQAILLRYRSVAPAGAF